MSDVANQFERAAALYRSKHYGAAYSVYEALANDGDVGAYLILGGMYRDGLGMPVNFDIALKWFTKAVDAGEVRSRSV